MVTSNCTDMHGSSSPVSKPFPVHAGLPDIFYEREPGAASRPAPLGYRRREPEKTAFYGVVRQHPETLLYEARQRDEFGIGYPRFVEHEFRRYLDCGLLSNRQGDKPLCARVSGFSLHAARTVHSLSPDRCMSDEPFFSHGRVDEASYSNPMQTLSWYHQDARSPP